ncbi:hypothetical protein ACFX5D_02655 [Flavobacterium sp. LB3P45]|uniref:Uncharacterized protein n=1 Tax=Flavobacterium fructosi TaxID=3230416 RepID=A0ABW6HIL9_9FLAO
MIFTNPYLAASIPILINIKDMPSYNSIKIPAEDAEKIMHTSLPIPKETSLMGNDYIEYFGSSTIFGNNFSLSINTDS